MVAYGQALTNFLFSDSEVKRIFSDAVARAANEPLRFRLLIGPTAQSLHNLYWETLRNPLDGTLLSANENILFSRYLASENWKEAHPRLRKEIKALVAIANPENLPKYGLSPIDSGGEISRARNNLGNISLNCLPTEQKRCTLANLTQELQKGYDILYLVAHGSMINGVPLVLLDDDQGQIKRISGRDLAEQINNLANPPLLVILASCESAGKAEEDRGDSESLQALGPLLSEAGVPAVIAMQGKISMRSVERMMPVFFEALQQDGTVDHALAAARNTLLAEKTPDLWMPTLFLRLANGKIWRDEEEIAQVAQVKTLSQRILALQWFWFVAIFLAIIGVGVGLFYALRPKVPEFMTGDFTIAVAAFAENGKSPQENLGYDLADSVRLRLEQDLKELNPELVITIWGPGQVGAIEGTTTEERAQQAERLAKKIHASMVIYGIVDFSQSNWQILPEFYISESNFYEANEIVGQNDLGTAFSVPGVSNTAWKYEFGKQMFTRGKALSGMSVGLGYFAVQDYNKAFESFQSTAETSGLDDAQGKKVLDLMLGIAAYKAGKFDEAAAALQQAIDLDPNYARPYVSMANLSYLRALAPFNQSKNPQDIDLAMLDNCFRYLDLGAQAPGKPPLAEVDTKIHFARGQCLWLKTYTGQLPTYDLAVDEFQQVITAYADGKNPRLFEMAGEAHARLGLIYRTLGNQPLAGAEYQAAANLLETIPARHDLYMKRANELLGITPTP